MPRQTDKHRKAAIAAATANGHNFAHSYFRWMLGGRYGWNQCRNEGCNAIARVTAYKWWGRLIKKQCEYQSPYSLPDWAHGALKEAAGRVPISGGDIEFVSEEARDEFNLFMDKEAAASEELGRYEDERTWYHCPECGEAINLAQDHVCPDPIVSGRTGETLVPCPTCGDTDTPGVVHGKDLHGFDTQHQCQTCKGTGLRVVSDSSPDTQPPEGDDE